MVRRDDIIKEWRKRSYGLYRLSWWVAGALVLGDLVFLALRLWTFRSLIEGMSPGELFAVCTPLLWRLILVTVLLVLAIEIVFRRMFGPAQPTAVSVRLGARKAPHRWLRFHLSTLVMTVALIGSVIGLNLHVETEVLPGTSYPIGEPPVQTDAFLRTRGWPLRWMSTPTPEMPAGSTEMEINWLCLSLNFVIFSFACALIYLWERHLAVDVRDQRPAPPPDQKSPPPAPNDP